MESLKLILMEDDEARDVVVSNDYTRWWHRQVDLDFAQLDQK
jgi:hypothetical protein